MKVTLVGVALLLALPLAIAMLALDASSRRRERAREQPGIESVVSRLPAPDFALSGGARWLRMPSLEEPAAALANSPVLPDPDPAGGVMAPPVEVWSEAPVREGSPR